MRGEMVEDVKRILIGIVILLIGILIFSRVITKPICDDMARASALQIADAISKVAENPDQYTFENGVPSLKKPEDEGKYATAVVRFCQEPPKWMPVDLPVIGGVMNLVTSNVEGLTGTIPLYQMYYEEAPGADAPWYVMWQDSYPWSGQTMNLLLFYGAFKYGTKAAKYSGKIASTVIKGALKLPGRVAAFGWKITLRNSRLGRFLSLGRSLTNKGWMREAIHNQIKKFGVAPLLKGEGGGRAALQKIAKFKNELEFTKALNGEVSGLSRTYNGVIKLGEGKYLFEPGSEAWKMLRTYRWTNQWQKRVGVSVVETLAEKQGDEELAILRKLGLFDCAKTGMCDDVGGKLIIKDAQTRKIFRSFLSTLPDNERAVYESIWEAPKWKWWKNPTYKRWYKVWKGLKEWKYNNAYVKWKDNLHARWRIWKSGAKYEGNQIDKYVVKREDAMRRVRDFKISCLQNREACKKIIGGVWKQDHPFRSAWRTLFKKDAVSEKELYQFLGDTETILKQNNWIMVQPKGMKRQALDIISEDMYQLEKELPVGKMALDFDEIQAQYPEMVKRWQKSTGKSIDELKMIHREYRAAMRETYESVCIPGIFCGFISSRERFDKALNKQYMKLLEKDPEEASMFLTMMTGKVDPDPSSVLWKANIPKRAKRIMTIDVMRFRAFFNPFYGGWSTQQYQQSLTQNLNIDNKNAIILTMYGGHSEVYPLSEKAKAYSVKLWRPIPDTLNRIPIFLNGIFLATSADYLKDPRFYTVSPCVGVAKVWRSGGTIYVAMEKDDNSKCSIKAPASGENKCEGAANYCYADYNLLWGNPDVDRNLWITFGGGLAGGLATQTLLMICPGPCVPLQAAQEVGKLVATGILSAYTFGDSSANPDNWGYWDWYKAADACDMYDMIFGLGKGSWTGKAATKLGTTQLSKLGKLSGKWTRAGMKTSKKLNAMLPDICMAIYAYGEWWSGWPNRGIKSGTPMSEPCMKQTAGQCVWGG